MYTFYILDEIGVSVRVICVVAVEYYMAVV
jgi:hypothetical protein